MVRTSGSRSSAPGILALITTGRYSHGARIASRSRRMRAHAVAHQPRRRQCLDRRLPGRLARQGFLWPSGAQPGRGHSSPMAAELTRPASPSPFAYRSRRGDSLGPPPSPTADQFEQLQRPQPSCLPRRVPRSPTRARRLQSGCPRSVHGHALSRGYQSAIARWIALTSDVQPRTVSQQPLGRELWLCVCHPDRASHPCG